MANVPIEQHPFWRPALLLLLAGVVLTTSFTYFDKLDEAGSAILRWYPQIKALMRGENVYAGEYPYPNTPIVALMLSPIVALPEAAGAMTLFALKVLMAFTAAWWSVELAVGRPSPPTPLPEGEGGGVRVVPLWALFVIGLLAARPLISDLQHGNINILVLFLVTAGLRLFYADRPTAAGAFIGLAAVSKVTPGLFVPYFVYKRQWRAVAGCFLGGLIAVSMPAVVLGLRTNFELHAAWAQQMVLPFLESGQTQYSVHINQSIPGLVARWLTERPGVDLGDQLGEHPVNVLSLSPATARWIVRLLSLGVLSWLAVICRHPLDDRKDRQWACEFGLVLIAMLMLSARSWKHHYVVIVLPLAVVVMNLAVGSPNRALRRYLIGTLAFVFVLTTLMSGDLIGWTYKGVAHKYVEAAGSFFWAGAALFVSLSVLRTRNGDPQ